MLPILSLILGVAAQEPFRMKTAAAKGKKPAASNKIAGVDDRTLDELIEVFKSLADRSRLLILMILAKEDEMHVSAICKLLGQSQPAVSHHLTQLRNAGLVSFRRDGKFNHYAIDSALAAAIINKFYPGANSAHQKLAFGEMEVTFKTK
jgi:ArsR family transcriptional regulator, arsenate/arsenite/antimonite-responsive transcriptional repressor